MMTSVEALTDMYILLMHQIDNMICFNGLSCTIYTKTSDGEHEINGLVTYDRKVQKMEMSRIKKINEDIIQTTKQIYIPLKSEP